MQKLTRVLAGCLLALASMHADAAQTIKSFNADSLPRIMASQKGKPFVLIVWSLDCAYCQASLGALAEEQRKRGNFNVVTLATDSLEDEQAAAQMKRKLQASSVTTDAWAFGSASPERLRHAIDPDWRGEMPRSYWFDAKGKRIAHSGAITAATIAKFMPK